MDGNTGLTLFEPSDLKLSIVGNEEDDEEALEDQKRRDEVLKAQLERAFDDWSDDEDMHTDKDRIQNSCNSPKSSTDDDDNNDDKTIDEARVHNNSKRKTNSRGLTFRNLSDISEHSMNKSGGHSTENSRVFTSGTELSQSTGEFSHLVGKNGEFQDGNQLVFKNNPHRPNQSNNKFVPIFITPTPSPPGIEYSYKQAVINERVEQNQQIFKNNFQERTSEKFQPFFNNTPPTEQSTAGSEEAYKQAEMSSGDQLEVLYQVRLKEIQRLDAQLQAERSDTAVYKQQTMLKMALLQSDKERALLSRSEADKLLVASKDEIANLQKEVATLKQALQDVEKDKKQCGELLEVSRVQIEELQDSMALMERCNSSMAMTKQTNLMVKSLKSKHQEELSLLQNQLGSVTKQLLEKEEESSHLKQKLDQVTVEKAATISQLTRSLEDSQHQCQKLLESNVMAENVGLQHKLNQVLLDKEELSQTVSNLKEECRLMKTELETLSPTDSMVQMGMISRSHSSERATNLQAELQRALLNQKAKRAEVERLQDIVSTKEKEIAEIKRQQQKSAVEKETLSVELEQVKGELISMRSKYEKMKEATEKKIVSDVARLSQNDHSLQPERENRERSKNSEIKIEADLQLKEMSVRLDQSLKEAKELKDMYLAVTSELGEVKAQLQEVSEHRDGLSKQLQTSLDQATLLHREKLELTSKVKELKNQIENICQSNEEEKLRQQCTGLQQELTSMSARHAQELSSARSELQATRDRVSQLEKTTRLQFETKIKTLHQEREMLKTKCDEKEVQIKKLIESRKRAPSTASVATETDPEVDWEEMLERERLRWRQEYEAAMALMENVYRDMEQKYLQDAENLRQSHLKAIDELQHQLATIEDRTKEKTIHFFSEKIHELEAKYQEELKRVSESSEVVRLKAEVADQSRQIEILSESLKRSNELERMRMKELEAERETERRQVALLIEQWSQEMKSTQEELKLKETNMKELKFKLESAKYCAKTNHDKLVKTNLELTETVNKKLADYRARIKKNVENYEKDVWEKVLKIESVYRNRERRLHQALKKQLMAEL